ncbi:MAG: succinate dehydrogenase assembly factor 2 [Thiothrix sp.]|nr:MAG: succinate dehydrogenase assembly factor 2 [Thiothrix sp.]
MNKDQILWRCRRGMLELDLLLRSYMNQKFDQLSEEDRARFITLLDYPDQTLLEILMGRQVPADPELISLASDIRSAAATA